VASADGRPKDAGVGSLELAIIAPTLLALIFLVIQGGLFFYGRSVALQAAREGVSQMRLAQTDAQCAALKDPVDGSTVEYAANVGRGALTAATATSTCTYGEDAPPTVTVRVQGQAISLLGFTLSIDESATGAVEQFETAGVSDG
jgi:Flp pilus assembly protein TadG